MLVANLLERDWDSSGPVPSQSSISLSDTRGTAPLPRLTCLHRIACPENGDIWRGEPGKEVRVSLSFVLSGECSLGAHGLLRFRTNDVLLGTSGVGCAYLLCQSPGNVLRVSVAE